MDLGSAKLISFRDYDRFITSGCRICKLGNNLLTRHEEGRWIDVTRGKGCNSLSRRICLSLFVY